VSGRPSSTPQIVPATEADLEEISRLAGVIWRAHYPGIISPEQIEYMLARMYSMETLREDLSGRGIRYERLLADEALAGFAAHGPTEHPAVVKLHKIYLHPHWQGRGLGGLLLRHCAGQAAGLGAHRLVLTVNKHNTKAIAVYQRHGFVITDAVVTDIGGGFVMDDYLMAKELRDARGQA
jgi:diamine N-acetyltransferase